VVFLPHHNTKTLFLRQDRRLYVAPLFLIVVVAPLSLAEVLLKLLLLLL
jgi:hypothetical protein